MCHINNCRVRSLCLCMLCALAVDDHSVLATSPGTTNVMSSLDANGVLVFFCDYALLVDRGVAHSPFGGTAENLFVLNMKEDDRLRKLLNLTDDQSKALLALPPSAAFLRSEATKAAPGSDSRGQETLDERPSAFEAILNDEQKSKLPLLYLNVEGLSAIRRPQFRALIGITLETQQRVSQLVVDYTERARLVHGRIFTLRNDQLADVPKLNLELRQMSAELDRTVLSLLSDAERLRLAKVVMEAADVAESVKGLSVGCSLQLLKYTPRTPELD